MITSTDGNEWQPGSSVVSSCHALAGQEFPGNRESRPRIIAEEEKKVPDCPPTSGRLLLQTATTRFTGKSATGGHRAPRPSSWAFRSHSSHAQW